MTAITPAKRYTRFLLTSLATVVLGRHPIIRRHAMHRIHARPLTTIVLILVTLLGPLPAMAWGQGCSDEATGK